MISDLCKGSIVKFYLKGETSKLEGLVLDEDAKSGKIKILYLNKEDDSIHTCYRDKGEVFDRSGDNSNSVGLDIKALNEWAGLLRYKRSCVEIKLSVLKASEDLIEDLVKTK